MIVGIQPPNYCVKMYLENFIIEIKILDNGEILPLDLIFIRGDSEEEIDKVFDKVRVQMDNTVKGRSHKVLMLTRNTQSLKEFMT